MDLVSTCWGGSRTVFGVLSLCPAGVGNRFSCMFGYLSFELLDLDAV
jgi:hypothetical protein